MITSKILQPSCVIFISLFFLAACQEQTETSSSTLKPSTSHQAQVVKEKAVVVPPEVLQRWKAVRLTVIDKTRKIENSYIIPIGSPFKVPSSQLVIVVETFLPSFKMQGITITSPTNNLDNPAIKVKISDSGAPVYQGWIFSKFPNKHALTHSKYGLSLTGAIPRSK